MAITSAVRQDIMELAVLMNDSAPGTTLLSELVAKSVAGSSLTEIAEHLAGRAEFTAKYPTFQTATEFANEWLASALPEADAALLAECVTIVEAHINGGGSIPALVVAVQTFLSDPANAAGAVKTHVDNFNNKVSVATYHTITKEADGEWAIPATVTSDATTVTTGNAAVDTATAPAAAAGSVNALTTGLDILTGGDGADTFSATSSTVSGATVATLNAGDNLTGGAGDDTLSLSNTSATAAYGAGVTTSGIENLSVNAVTATNVDGSLMSGITGVTNNGSLTAMSVTGLAAIPSVSVLASSANTTVGMTAATTVGTADEMTINLNGASGTAGSTITAQGIEKFTVNASGTASGALTRPVTLTSANTTDVTITGDAASAIAANLAGATATVQGTVTGNDAANTVILTAAGTDKISVSLGAGNDVMSIGTIGATHTIAGGDGTDTLASTAAITTTTGANISGFEAVSAGAVSVALPTAGNTINAVTFTGTGGTVAGVAAGATVTQAATGANTVSNTTGWTGTSDAISVSVGVRPLLARSLSH
jgi:hypothetical protein